LYRFAAFPLSDAAPTPPDPGAKGTPQEFEGRQSLHVQRSPRRGRFVANDVVGRIPNGVNPPRIHRRDDLVDLGLVTILKRFSEFYCRQFRRQLLRQFRVFPPVISKEKLRAAADASG
jgi:hypothetical protein